MKRKSQWFIIEPTARHVPVFELCGFLNPTKLQMSDCKKIKNKPEDLGTLFPHVLVTVTLCLLDQHIQLGFIYFDVKADVTAVVVK